MTTGDRCTVIMSTSPMPSCPSTAIIEETVATVRERLPNSKIIITADGVNQAQVDLAAAYEEYRYQLLRLEETPAWNNVEVVAFARFSQQSQMTKTVLPLVKTPVLFYVEHDLPLCGDIPIEKMCDGLESGDADVWRLTYNTDLEPWHAHMRLEEEPIDCHGVPGVRTWQWSQNPHLASTEYYRRIARDHFGDRRTYVEWVMSSVISSAWVSEGDRVWDRHRLWIYRPPGDIKRCYHLDGRAGSPVYDEKGEVVG